MRLLNEACLVAAIVALLFGAIRAVGDGTATSPSPTEEQLGLVWQELGRLQEAMSQYRYDRSSRPASLRVLVETGYLKDIPKNPLLKNDGSEAAVQDGSADWFYDPRAGTVAPGAPELARLLSPWRQIPQIIPDPRIQGLLRGLTDRTSKADIDTRMGALRRGVAGKDGWRRLLPQMWYYVLEANTEQAAWMAGYVINSFQLRNDMGSIVEAIWPYLATEDPKLSSVVQYAMDMASYEDYLRGAADCADEGFAVPPELFKYMFQGMHPGEALLACAKHLLGPNDPDRRRIVLAEHAITEMLWRQEHGVLGRDEVDPAAMAELQWLSESKHWWARLYVARMLQLSRVLRTEAVVKRLAEDENELVRSAAAPPPAAKPASRPALTDVGRVQTLADAIVRYAIDYNGEAPKIIEALGPYIGAKPHTPDYQSILHDMVVVTKGKVIGKPDPSHVIVVYREPKPGEATVPVGYLDGHSEEVPLEVFQKQLEASKRLFASEGAVGADSMPATSPSQPATRGVGPATQPAAP